MPAMRFHHHISGGRHNTARIQEVRTVTNTPQQCRRAAASLVSPNPNESRYSGIARLLKLLKRHRPRSTSTSLHVSPDPSAASPARYQRSGISDFPCSNTIDRNIGEKLVSYAVTLSEVIDVIQSLAQWPDPCFFYGSKHTQLLMTACWCHETWISICRPWSLTLLFQSWKS
jgi:hypothetical protein